MSDGSLCTEMYEILHEQAPQTHLYRYGEMEVYLRECGFKSISTYSNYKKEPAVDDQCEMFIFECGV